MSDFINQITNPSPPSLLPPMTGTPPPVTPSAPSIPPPTAPVAPIQTSPAATQVKVPTVLKVNVDGIPYKATWTKPTPPTPADQNLLIQGIRSSRDHQTAAFGTAKDTATEAAIANYTQRYLTDPDNTSIPNQILQKVKSLQPVARMDAIPAGLSPIGKLAIMRATLDPDQLKLPAPSPSAMLAQSAAGVGLPTTTNAKGQTVLTPDTLQQGTVAAAAQRTAHINNLIANRQTLADRLNGTPYATSDRNIDRAQLHNIEGQLKDLGITPPEIEPLTPGRVLSNVNKVASALISGNPQTETFQSALANAQPSAVGAVIDPLVGQHGTYQAAQQTPGFLPALATGITSFAEPSNILTMSALGRLTAPLAELSGVPGISPKVAKVAEGAAHYVPLAGFGAPVLGEAVQDIKKGDYGSAAGKTLAFLAPLGVGMATHGRGATETTPQIPEEVRTTYSQAFHDAATEAVKSGATPEEALQIGHQAGIDAARKSGTNFNPTHTTMVTNGDTGKLEETPVEVQHGGSHSPPWPLTVRLENGREHGRQPEDVRPIVQPTPARPQMPPESEQPVATTPATPAPEPAKPAEPGLTPGTATPAHAPVVPTVQGAGEVGPEQQGTTPPTPEANQLAEIKQQARAGAMAAIPQPATETPVQTATHSPEAIGVANAVATVLPKLPPEIAPEVNAAIDRFGEANAKGTPPELTGTTPVADQIANLMHENTGTPEHVANVLDAVTRIANDPTIRNMADPPNTEEMLAAAAREVTDRNASGKPNEFLPGEPAATTEPATAAEPTGARSEGNNTEGATTRTGGAEALVPAETAPTETPAANALPAEGLRQNAETATGNAPATAATEPGGDAAGTQSLRDRLATAKETARQDLKDSMNRANMNPKFLYHAAKLGAVHIAEGALDFADWSKQMIDDLGEVVRPHLEQIYKAAQQFHDNELQTMLGKQPIDRAAQNASAAPTEAQSATTEPLRASEPAATAPTPTEEKASLASDAQSQAQTAASGVPEGTPDGKEPWQMTREEFENQPNYYSRYSSGDASVSNNRGGGTWYKTGVSEHYKKIEADDYGGTEHHGRAFDLNNPYVATDEEMKSGGGYPSWVVDNTIRENFPDEYAKIMTENKRPSPRRFALLDTLFSEYLKGQGHDAAIFPNAHGGEEAFILNAERGINHKESVNQALSEGKDVPAEVLKDYPDIRPKEETPATNPTPSQEEAKPSAPPSGEGGETAPTEAPKPQEALTGGKNAITEYERQQMGLPEVERQPYTTMRQAAELGRAAVDANDRDEVFQKGAEGAKAIAGTDGDPKGPLDVRKVAEDVARDPRPLDARETGALIYDKARLINESETLRRLMTDAKGNPTILSELGPKIAENDRLRDLNQQALVKGGREQSAAFNARKMFQKPDYTLAESSDLWRANNGGAVIPLAKVEELRSLYEQLDKAKADFTKSEEARKTAEETLQKHISEATSNREVAEIAKEVKDQQRVAGRVRQRQAVDSEWNDLKSQLGKAAGLDRTPTGGGKLSMALDPTQGKFDEADLRKIAPILVKMARNRVELGTVKAGEIIDAIHKEVSDLGLTKRQISDAISGYGNKATRQTSQATTDFNNARKVMRLTSMLEDARNGQIPEKGTPPGKPSPEVVAAKKLLDAELKRQGKTPEGLSKAELTKVQKQIADLKAKRDGTAKTPAPRTPVTETPELKAARAERDALRKEIADSKRQAVQAKTVAEQQTAKENALNRQADALQKRVDAGGKAEPGKPPIPDTPGIKAAKAKIADLKDQLSKTPAEQARKAQADIDRTVKAKQDRLDYLNAKIASGDFSKPAKSTSVTSPEIESLNRQIEAAQKQYDDMKPKATREPLTDQQRLDRIKANQQKTIDALQKQVDTGEKPAAKRERVAYDAEAKANQAKIANLKDQIDKATKAAPGFLDTAVALRRAGFLISPRTHAKIALQHGALFAAHEASMPVGALADMIRAGITGTDRQVGGASLTGMWKALQKVKEQGFEGAKTILSKGEGTLHQIQAANMDPSNPYGQMSHTFGSNGDVQASRGEFNSRLELVNAFVNGPSRTHGAMYHVMQTYALARSIYEQASLSAINEYRKGNITKEQIPAHTQFYFDNPTTMMAINAISNAREMTLQNDNALATGLENAKRSITATKETTVTLPDGTKKTVVVPKFGGGKAAAAGIDIAIPFPKVPTNATARAIDFTGAPAVGNSAKMAYDLMKKNDIPDEQARRWAQTMGRLPVGAALTATGYAAYLWHRANGTLANTKERKQNDVTGNVPGAVNLFGREWDISNFGTPASNFILGASLAQAQDTQAKDRQAGRKEKAIRYGEALGHMMADQPLMNLGETYERAKSEGVGTALMGELATFVPGGNLTSDIAAQFDPLKRDVTASTFAPVFNRIPGLRETLPPKVNARGQGIPERANAYDPFRSVKPGALPLSGEERNKAEVLKREKEREKQASGR